jgi:hypothetical protein
LVEATLHMTTVNRRAIPWRLSGSPASPPPLFRPFTLKGRGQKYRCQTFPGRGGKGNFLSAWIHLYPIYEL